MYEEARHIVADGDVNDPKASCVCEGIVRVVSNDDRERAAGFIRTPKGYLQARGVSYRYPLQDKIQVYRGSRVDVWVYPWTSEEERRVDLRGTNEDVGRFKWDTLGLRIDAM